MKSQIYFELKIADISERISWLGSISDLKDWFLNYYYILWKKCEYFSHKGYTTYVDCFLIYDYSNYKLVFFTNPIWQNHLSREWPKKAGASEDINGTWVIMTRVVGSEHIRWVIQSSIGRPGEKWSNRSSVVNKKPVNEAENCGQGLPENPTVKWWIIQWMIREVASYLIMSSPLQHSDRATAFTNY